MNTQIPHAVKKAPVVIDSESETALFVPDQPGTTDIPKDTFQFAEELLLTLCDQYLLPLSSFKGQMGRWRYSRTSNRVVKLFCYIVCKHKKKSISSVLAGRFLHRSHASILSHMPDESLDFKLSKEDFKIYEKIKKKFSLGAPSGPPLEKEKKYDPIRRTYMKECLRFIEKEYAEGRRIKFSLSRKREEMSIRRLYMMLLHVPGSQKNTSHLVSHTMIVKEIGLGQDQSNVANAFMRHNDIMTVVYRDALDQRYYDLFLKGIRTFLPFFRKHELEVHKVFLEHIPYGIVEEFSRVHEHEKELHM